MLFQASSVLVPELSLPSLLSLLPWLVWPLAGWLGALWLVVQAGRDKPLRQSPAFSFYRLSAWPGTEWALRRYLQNKHELAQVHTGQCHKMGPYPVFSNSRQLSEAQTAEKS